MVGRYEKYSYSRLDVLMCFKIIDHGSDNQRHCRKMIFADAENGFGIQIKIVVRYYIPHTLGAFPVNRWVLCQQIAARYPVEVLQTFTDGDKHHADGVKPINTVIGGEKIIRCSDL